MPARSDAGLSSSGDEGARGSATLDVEGVDGAVDGEVELAGVAEGAVGQVVALQVAPGALDVVQLRRVLREPLARDAGRRAGRRVGVPARPRPGPGRGAPAGSPRSCGSARCRAPELQAGSPGAAAA